MAVILVTALMVAALSVRYGLNLEHVLSMAAGALFVGRVRQQARRLKEDDGSLRR